MRFQDYLDGPIPRDEERRLAALSNLKVAPRQIGDWTFKSRLHASARAYQRCENITTAQWEKFINDIVTKVNTFDRLKVEKEFMFYSKSLRQAMTVAVDYPNKEMRIFTVLDPGKSAAKPGTQRVMID